jgi:hypothetical protein
MRDPLGSIEFTDTKAERTLSGSLSPENFLYTTCAQQLVNDRQLISYDFEGQRKIISPKTLFVTYPYEWCNAQFIDAANLTLDISEKVLRAGYELKDASAWNVIFNACSPIFCDHLSFQKIERRQWWSFGQFVRHFILPLGVAKIIGLNAQNIFKLNRDGLTPEMAVNLLGIKRFFTRFWLLTIKTKTAASPNLAPKKGTKTVHHNLYPICRWFLTGASGRHSGSSNWSDYTQHRDHYLPATATQKKKTVHDWLVRISPNWVTDLGCNTGEFSKLAANSGAQVVSIDLDHDSIQNLYLSCEDQQIYPVIANLDDLYGGRGWGGREFAGLRDRLEHHSEVVLMLALIHHLAISSAIPYSEIFNLAALTTKRYLIVELLEHTDSMVVLLARQRDRMPEDFTLVKQLQTLEIYFSVLEQVPLVGSTRQLLLLEKK